MKASVIVFPGSNCDRDVAVSLEAAMGSKPAMVWHGEAQVPKTDLIVLPGGFSYGDYLRSGAMAAHSPIMRDVVAKAKHGTPVLGICNGFHLLTETGLLPGVLMRNASLKFICKDVLLKVERNDTDFARGYKQGEVIRIPIAHHDGNYFADEETLEHLEGANRVAETELHIGEKIRRIWSRFAAIFRARQRRPRLDSLYGDQLNELGLRLSDVERSALGENSACHPRGFSRDAMFGSPFGR